MIENLSFDKQFIDIIEVLGTIAFAISGIRLAAAKNFDWFGAYVVGLVTAIGGGTLRDVLLDIPVFWMLSYRYLAVTGISLVAVIIFRQFLVKGMRTLFLFFAGYPMWVAIVMGIITGSFGGITRDILINEVPLFFRKDIYATACLAGGVAYWLLSWPGIPVWVPQGGCAVVIVGLRVLAVHYNWSLPILKVDEKSLPDK